MSIPRLAILALMAAGGSSWACSSSSSDPGTGTAGASTSDSCAKETRAEPYSAGETFEGTDGLSLALMDSDPAPPALGDNTWTIEIKDSAGSAISDATVTADQKMVDHGHGGAKRINVTSVGDGTYQASPVNFNMSGYWTTTFHVTTATLSDASAVVKVCIP